MQTETILKEMEKAFGEVRAVLEEYEPYVKYRYIEAEIEIAFLGVSRRVFEEDAREGAYGGFIADRIING